MEPNTGCHLWIAFVNEDGYGAFRFGSMQRAHRVAYESEFGSIPDGLEIDHLCRVRSCVNPEHLEAVTHTENVARGSGNPSKNNTHCINGHEFSTSNTYTNSGRQCKTCIKSASAKRYLAKVRNKDAGVRNKYKTHCIHGHQLSGDNLYVAPKGTKRECRACKRRRHLEKKK